MTDSVRRIQRRQVDATPSSSAADQLTADAARRQLARAGRPGGPIFFACFSRRGATRLADIEEVLPAHRDWVVDQEAVGRIVVSGPLLTNNFSWDGDEFLVFRVDSAQDAEQLIGEDPMHHLGLRTFQIIPWQLNEGSLGIGLTLSQGHVEFW